METNRCVNCMSEMQHSAGRYCPVCGFDNQNVQQPIYALKLNYILHGRYLIGRVLGQGGFGITYVGLDMVLDLKVAIKEYFPMGMVTRQDMSSTLLWNPSQASQTQRQSGCDSFLKEARKMAKMDANPTIVRVRDTFLENETAYIVMDFVEGHTLKEELQKNGPMPFPKCMGLLRSMMEGLAKVHQQGIVHRDISPDNIIVQPDGGVKLIDLGTAKDITLSNGQSSQVVAKKGFSPIEQYVEKGEIGSWTDVYALCATICYCITGKLLPDATERMLMQGGQQDPVLPDYLPNNVAQALKDGLALKAEDRIRDVGQLLQRLDAQAPSGQPVSEKKETQAPSRQPVSQQTYGNTGTNTNTGNYVNGGNTVNTGNNVNPQNDNGGFGWWALGCCIPIAGLVLFLVYKDQKPNTAKAAGVGALVSVVLVIVFYILLFLIALTA